MIWMRVQLSVQWDTVRPENLAPTSHHAPSLSIAIFSSIRDLLFAGRFPWLTAG